MRSIFAVSFAITLAAACGSNKNGGDDGDGGNQPADACVGLECQVVNCAAMGQTPTTLTGTIFAPNGTLPLYGITVYVPLNDPGVPMDALECDRCSSSLPGGAVAQATSGEDGKFRLENVPVGDNIPLVIKSGKWQRKVTIPRVEQCVDTPLVAADTSLPKNKTEGNIPKIAVTTGSADSLECLIRRLGIADTEISKTGDTGRIHLYTGNGTNSFKAGFPGGMGAIPTATTFWNDVNNLKNYDIVILSCEGAQNPGTKPQPALDAMKSYADQGGRVFASHWHNIWISGNFQGNPALKPAVWDTIATWNDAGSLPNNSIDLIDETANPKGSAFANWMVNVGGSPVTRGEVPLVNGTGKTTAVQVDPAKAERWTYVKDAAGRTQNFQFTVPNEVTPDNRCGKVVFSDMHVSGNAGGGAYPDSCGGATTLTPQEKALAFMFFDIASCVGGIL